MPDPTIKTSTQPTSYPTDRTARFIMCTYLRAMGSLNLINYMLKINARYWNPASTDITKYQKEQLSFGCTDYWKQPPCQH